MKPDIHPDYRQVVFFDIAANAGVLTRSTATSSDTMEWTGGNIYPVIRVDVSNVTHPLWTGTQRVLDSAGRVERFRQRYGTRRPGGS